MIDKTMKELISYERQENEEDKITENETKLCYIK